MHVRNMPYEI
uniref:Uncharacterized protein n=1 Tax=Anguilla anguilla TaxID=7936 RepID=A0A0E9XZF5_ANGAN